jgi:hypothetical protein
MMYQLNLFCYGHCVHEFTTKVVLYKYLCLSSVCENENSNATCLYVYFSLIWNLNWNFSIFERHYLQISLTQRIVRSTFFASKASSIFKMFFHCVLYKIKKSILVKTSVCITLTAICLLCGKTFKIKRMFISSNDDIYQFL